MKHHALVFLIATACAVDMEEGVDDAIDAPFLDADGKADGLGLSEAELAGVLQVANEVSTDELRAAGLTRRAAGNIVAGRPYDSLAALDAVPYVGPATLGRLIAYADTHGYTIDHFQLPSCAPMTHDDVIARFSRGASTYDAPTGFQLAARTRPCNAFTGCGAWDATALRLRQAAPGDGVPVTSLHRPATTGRTRAFLQRWGTVDLVMWSPEPGRPSINIEWQCAGVQPDQLANTFDCESHIDGTSGYLVDNPYEPFTLANERGELRIGFRGVICRDGRYAFLSRLAPELGTPLDGANNKTQIAIWGEL